jgi:hypothetical protein
MEPKISGSSDPVVGTRPASGSEIDYSPKQYTRAETIRYGGRFLAVAVVILALLWLVEKLSF